MLSFHDAIVIFLKTGWIAQEDSQSITRVGAGVHVLRNDWHKGIARLLERKRNGDEGNLRAVAMAGLLEQRILPAAVRAGVVEYHDDAVLGARRAKDRPIVGIDGNAVVVEGDLIRCRRSRRLSR